MSDENTSVDVIVVGAGPTGLTLACELRRHDLSTRIFDRSPMPSDKSKALAVHSRSLEVFEAMGALSRFEQEGLHVRRIVVHANAKTLLSLSLDELDSPHPYTICIPQSKTEEFLAEHLNALGSIVERGIELVGLEQDEKGVTATLRHADAVEEVIRSRWLVGCDGAHSATRHLLNFAFEGSQYPEVFMLADVRLDSPLDHEAVHVFASDSGLLAVFPFGKNRVRIVADMAPDSKNPLPAGHGPDALPHLSDPTLEEFQKIMDERTVPGCKLSDPVWLTSFSLHHRQVASYCDRRIFLAGDAAHIHSPAGGQGMNTGIQDSYNLAWKLALVTKGAAHRSLLDSYNTERHAVGQSVLKMTDLMTKVNTLRNPIAQKLRNTLAPVLAAQEIFQQRMRGSLSELAINYRKSPIVAEHMISLVHAAPISHPKPDEPTIGDWFVFEHGPHPGDRCPDAHLLDPRTESPMRLFDLLRRREHQLILFAGTRTSGDVVRALIEIGTFVVDRYGEHIRAHLILESELSQDLPAWANAFLMDADLSAHHKYGADSECLYLIRPDGYIAFRSQPAEKAALEAYLETIFV